MLKGQFHGFVHVQALVLAVVNFTVSYWTRWLKLGLSPGGSSTTAKSGSTQTFLEHLNSVEPCITFTIERENESKIAFLDTMVHHQEDGKLITTVYQKPTHTDRYLSYLSHHPSTFPKPFINAELGETVSLHVTPCKGAGNLQFSFVKNRQTAVTFQRFMPVSSIFCWLVLAIWVLFYDRNNFRTAFISGA